MKTENEPDVEEPRLPEAPPATQKRFRIVKLEERIAPRLGNTSTPTSFYSAEGSDLSIYWPLIYSRQ